MAADHGGKETDICRFRLVLQLSPERPQIDLGWLLGIHRHNAREHPPANLLTRLTSRNALSFPHKSVIYPTDCNWNTSHGPIAMRTKNEFHHDGNPFSEQVVSEYFVGREEELSVFEKNLHALKSGAPNHCFVAGIEGTGKTAYLNKIVEIAISQNCIGVHLPLDPLPAHRQIGTILRATIDALRKQTALNGETQFVPYRTAWSTLVEASRRVKAFQHRDVHSGIRSVQSGRSPDDGI